MGANEHVPAWTPSSLIRTLRDQYRQRRFIGGATPLRRLARFSQVIGVEVFAKRDDEASFAFAGAKARKLEMVLGTALAQGYEALITMGPPQSNTCRALAAACAGAGLQAHLVLAGDPPKDLSGNALLAAILGAQIKWVGPLEHSKLEAALVERARELNKSGLRTLTVSAGCSDVRGIMGMAAGYAEMMNQCEKLGVEPAEIVHASATGGIWAGLELGAALLGGARPIAALVVDNLFADTRATYADLFNSASAALGLTERRTSDEVRVDASEVAGGYGQPSPECLDAIALLARTEGIVCDPIYTGKALAVLIRRARSGLIDGPVVFWHSGGVQTLGDHGVVQTLNQRFNVQ